MTEGKIFDGNLMVKNVALEIADLLNLPENIVWYELIFGYREEPLMRFSCIDSENIESMNIVFTDNTNGEKGQNISDDVALKIASLLKLPDHFSQYKLRFEAAEWPTVTIVQELHSAYENTEVIKAGIEKLKKKYHMEAKRVDEEEKIVNTLNGGVEKWVT